jgi:glucan biosynthesis protein C
MDRLESLRSTAPKAVSHGIEGVAPMSKTLHMDSGRRYGIDWLRVLATYLLFPVHVACVFSPLPFYHIRNGTVSFGMLVFLAVVEPWIMPLFFVLAGWAAFYSVRARGSRHFVKERFQKLLIPLLAGCVLFGPPIKYLELRSGFDLTPMSLCSTVDPTHRFGPCIPAGPKIRPPIDESFLEFWPTYFARFERFSWSHLWFLGYLFTLSLVYLPLFLWLVKSRYNPDQVGAAWLYLPMVPLLLIEIVLRPHWPGVQNLYHDWANMAYYSTCLVAGFLLGRFPALEQCLQREWKRALWIGLAGTAVRVPSAVGLVLSPVLSFVSLVVAGWGIIIALLGFAQSYLTHRNAVLGYLSESAFPVYIIHQAAIVCIGYGIVQLSLGIGAKYLLLLVAAVLATHGIYQLAVRPIPVLRFAFGLKPMPRKGSPAGASRKMLDAS